MLDKAIDIIDKTTDKLGKSVALLNILMVLVMCLVVGLRYLFNHSSIMLQESVMYLHAVIFMIGMGYTLKADEHVRVDIIYQRLSDKWKATVNLLGTLLLMLPVLIFIAWYSWDYINSAWVIKEVSQEAAGLPYVYLLKTLIIAMVACLALQGICEVLKSCRTLMHSTQDSTHG